MATNGTDSDAGVFEEFSARLRERWVKAQQEGDLASVVRYDAMQAVLRTKLVPLVCPDAVTLAGDAARAACEGREEGEWLQGVCKERDHSGQDRVALFKAVRLLKTVGIWPWAPAEHAWAAVGEGSGSASLGTSAGAAGPKPTESAMGLGV